MSEKRNNQIIAFVGLTGSGKSSAVEYVTDMGFPKVYAGGLIVEGVRDLGLEVNPENEKAYREDMRAKFGNDYFINKCIDQMNDLIEAGQRKIVFDGLYTWTEYRALKHAFPGELTVIAVVTPRPLRYRRLSTRPIRPLTADEAQQRDWAEIENLEKGGPIAIADYYVHNDSDLDNLHRQIDRITEELRFTT